MGGNSSKDKRQESLRTVTSSPDLSRLATLAPTPGVPMVSRRTPLASPQSNRISLSWARTTAVTSPEELLPNDASPKSLVPKRLTKAKSSSDFYLFSKSDSAKAMLKPQSPQEEKHRSCESLMSIVASSRRDELVDSRAQTKRSRVSRSKTQPPKKAPPPPPSRAKRKSVHLSYEFKDLNDEDIDEGISESQKHWLRKEHRYTIGRLLGCGSFAYVYEAKKGDSDTKVAIKIVNKQLMEIIAHASGSDIKNEIMLLSRLNHENIISSSISFEDDQKLYIVMDLMTGGDLLKRASNWPISEFLNVDLTRSSQEFKKPCDEDALRPVMRQILSGLAYAHSQNIVHRDLKPENVMFVSEGGPLKIIDFGLAEDVTARTLFDVCGTTEFQSPEMIARVGYRFEVDIWAAGIMFYMLVCGKPPFEARNNKILQSRIMKEQPSYQEPAWLFVTPNARQLVERMLDSNPKTRITAAAALEHPWFCK